MYVYIYMYIYILRLIFLGSAPEDRWLNHGFPANPARLNPIGKYVDQNKTKTHFTNNASRGINT